MNTDPKTHMAESNEICRLDYFFGTLATAYKGVITSLAARDFCMIEEGGLVTLKGTVLSVPKGDYETRLMREGKELARAALKDGVFEFNVEKTLIDEAKNLQIDIIQKGRHIGTFLLKRERSDEFYTSAVELSDDLRELSPAKLTAPLRGRPGLLRRAEGIISIIISPKRDWRRLTEEINSLARDLYWTDLNAYLTWYPMMVRWSARVCSMSNDEFASRAVSNFLAQAALILDNGPAAQGKELIARWLETLESVRVDLALSLQESERVLLCIDKLYPDMDITAAVKDLIHSLSARIEKAPVLGEIMLQKLRSFAGDEDISALTEYSEGRRSEAVDFLNSAGALVESREFQRLFGQIREKTALLLDDSVMVDRLFGVLERNADPRSPRSPRFTEQIGDLFASAIEMLPGLSSDTLRRVSLSASRFIISLINKEMVLLCRNIIGSIDKSSPAVIEGILLNLDVSSSIASANDHGLMDQYAAAIGRLWIPSPRIKGFSSETWAEVSDHKHLERLSKFLDVLAAAKGSLNDVLIRILCNLYVSGVFIPDDRLFQRNVSAYLNSGCLNTDFLINYLLLKRLPVYFNEVGATSTIRDDTTEIDSWANDMLLYFLRKQIHVNSSNYNIRLLEEIIRSWVNDDHAHLKEMVPGDVYQGINAELISSYSRLIRPFFAAIGVLDEKGLHLERLLPLPFNQIEKAIKGIGTAEDERIDEVRRKIVLICRIYRETVYKYNLVSFDAPEQKAIQRLSENIKKIRNFKEALTSPQKTSPEENLFFKRHIAFGIPSVLGTYHEEKFDALSGMLRSERRMIPLFEEIIMEARQASDCLDEEALRRWINCLDIMNDLAKTYGIDNFQISELLTIMKYDSLHISQIVDLLRMWQKEITWTVDSFARRIHSPLTEILKIIPADDTVEHLRGLDTASGDYVDRAADIVIRDMISDIAGFTEMDRFVEILINRCRSSIQSKPDILLLRKEPVFPEADFFSLESIQNSEAMRLAPTIGGKAKNLVYLFNGGLPVPAASIFPAGKTANYLEFTGTADFMAALKRAVGIIEEVTGQTFGDPSRPLFLSVRSGSYISMPGILSSVLYCGMNEQTREGFANLTGDPRLSWDSYRRFVDHYATVVLGLGEKIFGEISERFLTAKSKLMLDDLDSDQMSELVRLYLAELDARDLAIPQDVYIQLRESVKAVYRSWFGEKAVQFRAAMEISEHWGTAVLIMQMISGNRTGCGASVFFTRKPSSIEKGAYGDTREIASGDDLVYGRLINRPLTRDQALDGQLSLEETDPELYRMHEDLADKIEKSMGGLPQEVEATYVTSPAGDRKIFVLQTRRMEFHRGFVKHFRDICMMESSIIGRGVGVHGGALSGVAAFADSPDEIRRLRKSTGMHVILLRRLSSTQDVSLMPHIDGIVTSAGGATSHAAILAQKFGLAAVVGCSDMTIASEGDGTPYAIIGNHKVIEGSLLSIDGSTGLVYSGVCQFTVSTKM